MSQMMRNSQDGCGLPGVAQAELGFRPGLLVATQWREAWTCRPASEQARCPGGGGTVGGGRSVPRQGSNAACSRTALPSQSSPLGHASDCRVPCAALSPPGLSGSGFPGWGSAAEGAPHPQGGEVAARRRGAGPAAVRRLRPAPRAGRNLSRPFVFRAEAWAPALTDAPHGLLCRPSSLHCTHFTRLQTHGPLSPPLPFPGPLVSR